jgi:hypothetical protein
MLLVKINNAGSNPYRDFDMNPINDEGPVVENLRISIKKNGLWTKFMARPADESVTEKDLEKLADKFGTKKPCPLVVEKWYGHNTQRAAELEGIKTMLMDVRPTDDVQMMTSMAYENKMDSKENMMVMIETVAQTQGFIVGSLDGLGEGDFKKYKDDGGKLFTSAAQYKNVIQKGVGYGSIMKLLEGWQEGDVKNSLRVLKDLSAERYAREDIADMPSVGILGQYSRLVESVLATTWPVFWKEDILAGCTAAIKDPQVSTTVKILKNAIKGVRDKDGACDPLRYIRKNVKKPFDVVKATKDLVFENSTEGAPTIDDLANMEGFKGYEDIVKLVKDVQASIDKTVQGREGADGEGGKDGGGGDDAPDSSTEPVPTSGAEAEAAVTAASSAVEDALTALSALPIDGEDDAEPTISPAATAELYTRNASVMNNLAAQLTNMSGSINADDHPELYDAAEASLRATHALCLNLFAEDAVDEMLSGE